MVPDVGRLERSMEDADADEDEVYPDRAKSVISSASPNEAEAEVDIESR